MKIEIKSIFGKILFEGDFSCIADAVTSAVKQKANLSGANLSWTNLSWTNLSEANLSGANLSGANLFRANLFRANLFRANLSGANLFRANLFRANLFRADLSEADLSEADLSEANLSQKIKPLPIQQMVLKAINHNGNAIEMNDWHTCETTHCRAGWATHLHPEGALLESIYGTSAAAALIFNACGSPIPSFTCGNDDAMEDIINQAELEKERMGDIAVLMPGFLK